MNIKQPSFMLLKKILSFPRVASSLPITYSSYQLYLFWYQSTPDNCKQLSLFLMHSVSALAGRKDTSFNHQEKNTHTHAHTHNTLPLYLQYINSILLFFPGNFNIKNKVESSKHWWKWIYMTNTNMSVMQ
jgi:hypothetical protein